MSFDANSHLRCVLESHSIGKMEDTRDKYLEKRDKIKEELGTQFSGKIYSPINSGSYAKSTIVNIEFDLDLAVPFKRASYSTLLKMYDAVYDYFDKDYRKKDTSLIGVKKQKVSIGLEFLDDFELLSIDVVPGRELNDDQYSKDKTMNLFLRDEKWGKVTYIQTNIEDQLKYILGKSEEREIIKLLKVWKIRGSKAMKSFLIELVTIRAFEDVETMPTDLWGRLKATMEYIRDNIKTVSLVDPGNSGNVVSDTLEDFEKDVVESDMKGMLSAIATSPQLLETYFPINPNYPCEEKKKEAFYEKKSDKPSQLGVAGFGN